MMRLEAGVNERIPPRLGIKNRNLAVGPLQRKHLGRGMVGPLLAKVGVGGIAKPCREPDSSFSVEHTVVIVSFAIPDFLPSPVRGRLHKLVACHMARPECLRRVGITHGCDNFRRGMLYWIEDRNYVRAVLGRPINWTVAVESLGAAIRGDLIIQVEGIIVSIGCGNDR